MACHRRQQLRRPERRRGGEAARELHRLCRRARWDRHARSTLARPRRRRGRAGRPRGICESVPRLAKSAEIAREARRRRRARDAATARRARSRSASSAGSRFASDARTHERYPRGESGACRRSAGRSSSTSPWGRSNPRRSPARSSSSAAVSSESEPTAATTNFIDPSCMVRVSPASRDPLSLVGAIGCCVGGSMSAFRSATTDSSRGIGDLVQTIAARCAAGRTSPEFQISYGQYSFTAIAVGRIGICDSDWRCGRTPASSSMRETRGRLGAAHSRLARPSVQAGGDRASVALERRRRGGASRAPFNRCRGPARRPRARGGSSLAR